MVAGSGIWQCGRWHCCVIGAVMVMFENDGVGYGCDGMYRWLVVPLMDWWCLTIGGSGLVVGCDGGCTRWCGSDWLAVVVVVVN